MARQFLQDAAKKDATVSRESEPARLDYPRACRIVRRADFDAVYREGRRRASSSFVVFLRPNGSEVSRFGLSVKRALGSAVKRNRIRRRVREILRVHRREIAPGWDIVIHPRGQVATAQFALVEKELMNAVPKVAQ